MSSESPEVNCNDDQRHAYTKRPHEERDDEKGHLVYRADVWSNRGTTCRGHQERDE